MSALVPVVVGFIPLVDCAILAVAREKGFAAAEGIELTLVRESSWANIRDRLIVGHFDAAHMLGPMTIASTLGIGHVEAALVAPFALGLGGNAITLSLALASAIHDESAAEGSPPTTAAGWARRALDIGQALRRVVTRRASARLEPLTFGMVYPFSSHNYELRYWLAAVGIDPDRDVRLVVIPPPLLADSMRAGYIDGFCVGEPWNSVAVDAGVGVLALPTTAIWRQSPEKVLGCRRDWAERKPEELSSLLRGLYRAAEWCARPKNHRELAQMLSEPKYVGSAAEVVERAFSGVLALSAGGPRVQVEDFYVARENAATFPWTSHALWFYSQMVRWGQTEWSEAALARVRTTFRPDLYRKALAPLRLNIPTVGAKVESAEAVEVASSYGTFRLAPCGFLDDRVFDASDVYAYVKSFAHDETS